jgi:uncharacterized membrane protein YphA (DoxX/SURF4 family)
MSKPRLLMAIRLVLGLLLLRQGALGMTDLPHLARTVELHNAWQSWPLVGDLRPMGVALWIAGGQLTVGIFLVAGLLTRVMALGAALLSLFALLTLWDLGTIPNLAHGAIFAASLLILVKGGGAGTMDKLLGAMQRRSIEREAAREAERLARSEAPESASSPRG